MSRLLIALAALAFASSLRAEEVEVKFAAVGAKSMKEVRRIDIEPRYLENLLVRPWARLDAQFVATKAAADKTALDAMRVEVTVEGDRMSIRLGERVKGVWAPLRQGSRIDLVVNVPARLMGLLPKRPIEPSGEPGAVATR